MATETKETILSEIEVEEQYMKYQQQQRQNKKEKQQLENLYQEAARNRIKQYKHVCASSECINVHATLENCAYVCKTCHQRFCTYCVNHTSIERMPIGDRGGDLLCYCLFYAFYSVFDFLRCWINPKYKFHRQCRSCFAKNPLVDVQYVSIQFQNDNHLLPSLRKNNSCCH